MKKTGNQHGGWLAEPKTAVSAHIQRNIIVHRSVINTGVPSLLRRENSYHEA